MLCTLAVYESKRPETGGVLEIDPEGKVVSFEEKPKMPRSNLISSGIFITTNRIFDYFPEKNSIDFGYDVLPRLVGNMVAYIMKEFIQDIGTIESYLEVCKIAKNLDLG